MTALDTLNVEPGQSPAHKADRRGLLFVSKNLDVGQASRVAPSMATWTHS
jgi:hypothetical protein